MERFYLVYNNSCKKHEFLYIKYNESCKKHESFYIEYNESCKSMNFSTLSIINHVKSRNFSTLSIMIRVKSIMNSSLVYEIAWGFSSLSASIFSTPEYCGNTLEDIERKMDQTSGLCEYRLAFLHNQQSVGCHWKYTVH